MKSGQMKRRVAMGERFSRHAAERAGQRRIKAEDVNLVLRFGKEIHRAGAIFVFLGHRDIPEQLRHDRHLIGLEGMTVIMSSDCEQVITAYRNRHAIKDIKRKAKRFRPKTEGMWH